MNLNEVASATRTIFLASGRFPYRTGQLKRNFFGQLNTVGDGVIEYNLMENKIVNYGKILENAPTIRYKLRKVGTAKYSYIKRNNKHFRYIDRIIESDVIPMLESQFGVEYVK